MGKAIWFGALLCMFMGLFPESARAQAIRLGRSRFTPLTAAVGLTVSASPTSVALSLVSGKLTAASNAINITTSGLCALGLVTPCTVRLYGYFSSSTAALSGGSPVVNIPTSEVLGQVPNGSPTTFTPFTQSGPFGGAGASLLLTNTVYTASFNSTASLSLEIDLANQRQLPAGTYSGTLFLQAQTF